MPYGGRRPIVTDDEPEIRPLPHPPYRWRFKTVWKTLTFSAANIGMMQWVKAVAVYARVSTRERQDNENQLAQLREFRRRQGWNIVHEFVDRPSGKNSAREQFRAMFAAASRREFDAVVSWALDRLSREGVAQTFEHIKTLLGYGVQYISYTEAHFRTTGPAGELMIAIAAWIAQQERQQRVTKSENEIS